MLLGKITPVFVLGLLSEIVLFSTNTEDDASTGFSSTDGAATGILISDRVATGLIPNTS